MDSSLVTALLGSGGAAGVALVLILLGVLVPSTYHKRVIEENEKLAQANDVLAAANAQLREANSNLTSSGQLTNQVVTALLDIAAQNRGTGAAAGSLPAIPKGS